MVNLRTARREVSHPGRWFAFAAAASFAVAATCSLAAAHAADQSAAIPVPLVSAAPAIDGSIGAAWAGASQITLEHDFTNRRAADEPTHVAIEQDGAALDVAFDVRYFGAPKGT